MLKKALKTFSAVLLAVAMVFPVQLAVAQESETSDYSYKLQTQLMDIMEKTPDEEKISVWLWFQDCDKDAAYKEYFERLEQYNEDDYTPMEWMNLKIQIENEILHKYYEKHNAEMFSQLNIPEEDVIQRPADVPVFIVKLTKADIWRYAENPLVTLIYYYEDAEYVPDIDVVVPDDMENNASKIAPELRELMDGTDKLYNVIIYRHQIGFDIESSDWFFSELGYNQRESEYFVEKYLADAETKCFYSLIYAEISESDIYRIAQQYDVELIKPAGDITKEDIMTYQDEFATEVTLYNAAAAMKIQRMSIGLDEYKYLDGYDIDRDGKITTRDAMYALRSSINLVYITPAFTYKMEVIQFCNKMNIQSP